MASPEERLEKWMTVDKQTLWGTASPFDLVDGGKEKLMKELLAVTSDVKHYPADGAPYGSLLVGRLATKSDLSQRPRSRTSACSSRWTRTLLTSKCGRLA